MLALIVDDEPAIRDFIRAILEREGFTTMEAGGGKSAMELVERFGNRLRLIVTDLYMPEGDGLTFAYSVRIRYPTLPIILVSGRVRPDAPFDFVEKPFSWSTLHEAVRRAVGPMAKLA